MATPLCDDCRTEMYPFTNEWGGRSWGCDDCGWSFDVEPENEEMARAPRKTPRKSAAKKATTAVASPPAELPPLPTPKARLVTEEYELPIKRCGYGYGSSSGNVRLTVHYKDGDIEKLDINDGDYTFNNRDELIQTCQMILAIAQRMKPPAPPKPKKPRKRAARKATARRSST